MEGLPCSYSVRLWWSRFPTFTKKNIREAHGGQSEMKSYSGIRNQTSFLPFVWRALFYAQWSFRRRRCASLKRFHFVGGVSADPQGAVRSGPNATVTATNKATNPSNNTSLTKPSHKVPYSEIRAITQDCFVWAHYPPGTYLIEVAKQGIPEEAALR